MKTTMNILGISTSMPDTGACLLKDGRILCAVQEEMFPRRKQEKTFPVNSVRHCLEIGKLKISDLDLIVFCENPLPQGERILMTAFTRAPRGFQSFLREMLPWVTQQTWVAKTIFSANGFKGRILFPGRHECLAASAFFSSPFSNAAILTMDSGCEKATTAYGTGKFNTLSIMEKQYFPHSINLFFSAFLDHLGLDLNQTDEFTRMASLGGKKYLKLVQENLLDLKQDGSFLLNMIFFNFPRNNTLNANKLHALLDIPADQTLAMNAFARDLAKAAMEVIEEIIRRTLCHLHEASGMKNLCLTESQVLASINLNKIVASTGFDSYHVQSGNSSATCAVLFAWHEYLGRCQKLKRFPQKDTLKKEMS